MNYVAITKCNSYKEDEVETAIRKIFSLLDLPIRLREGIRILIKPNILSSTKGPDLPVNTHPVVITVLARILKEDFHCEVFVGDSCGGASYGRTKIAFETMKLYKIAEDTGVNLVDFERLPLVKVENSNGIIMKKFYITQIIKEVDFIISVPKFKTHSLVGFTGAVKNMMGIVPGSGKRQMHINAPTPDLMADCILDLFEIRRPDLAIMDAVIGMEGEGPAVGNPKQIGYIMGSFDSVALDRVCLHMAGIPVEMVPFISKAGERGLGETDMTRVHIVGEDIDSIKIKGFRLPSTLERYRYIKYIPRFLLRQGFRGMTSGVPVISSKKCKLCSICVKSCPKSAMKIEKGRVKINYKECIECYCCQELCPHNAIEIKLPLKLRIWEIIVRIGKRLLGMFTHLGRMNKYS